MKCEPTSCQGGSRYAVLLAVVNGEADPPPHWSDILPSPTGFLYHELELDLIESRRLITSVATPDHLTVLPVDPEDQDLKAPIAIQRALWDSSSRDKHLIVGCFSRHRPKCPCPKALQRGRLDCVGISWQDPSGSGSWSPRDKRQCSLVAAQSRRVFSGGQEILENDPY